MKTTINRVTQRPRKPGSGRKRKHGAITSKDYANQLQQLEREALNTNLTKEQRDTLRKQKRSLKNRMSALKSRENKRSKIDQLEQTVQDLQRQLEILAQENQALRQSGCSAANKSQTISSSPPSLSPSCSETQKISTPVKPCTHNCGSAVFTSRNSHPLRMTGQYSHMLWEMPWKTLRSIFSTLWIVSKTLIASRNTKDLLKATIAYQETQRLLRQIFSKTLTLCPQSDILTHFAKEFPESTATDSTLEQQAFVIFDRISRKFLLRAMSKQRNRV